MAVRPPRSPRKTGAACRVPGSERVCIALQRQLCLPPETVRKRPRDRGSAPLVAVVRATPRDSRNDDTTHDIPMPAMGATRQEDGRAMTGGMRRKLVFACSSVMTIILGTLSRVVQTQNIMVDKYLGDMLYAVLMYWLMSFVWTTATPRTKLLLTTLIMILIEAFQLTGLPLSFRGSESVALHLLALALGTTFSVFDIIAYVVGIVLVSLFDRQWITRRRSPQQ